MYDYMYIHVHMLGNGVLPPWLKDTSLCVIVHSMSVTAHVGHCACFVLRNVFTLFNNFNNCVSLRHRTVARYLISYVIRSGVHNVDHEGMWSYVLCIVCSFCARLCTSLTFD
jgi:hypothetical protein